MSSQTILTISALLAAVSIIWLQSEMSASSWVTRQSSLLTSCTLFCRGHQHRMLARRLLFLEFFRIASLNGSGELGVRWRSFDWFLAANHSLGLLDINFHPKLFSYFVYFTNISSASSFSFSANNAVSSAYI